MGKRHTGRRLAMQVLYQLGVGKVSFDEAYDSAISSGESTVEAQGFARPLAEGAWTHHDELDKRIAEHAKDWDVNRLAWVDRSILRLALYEIFYCPQTPRPVVIDEALELAKRYGGEDSPKFINGILGAAISAPPAPSSRPSDTI